MQDANNSNVITQFYDTIVEDCTAEYHVGRRIGCSEFSFVYLCTERNSNRIVAIKAPRCEFNYKYDNLTYSVTSLNIITHHRGIPVADEYSELSRENIFWISNLKDFRLPFIGVYQVGNRYHNLNLKHCIMIWGFDPFPLFDNPVFAINKQQIVGSDGKTTYTVPIITHSYHLWINRRHKLLQEVVALNKIGIHPNIVRFHKLLEKVMHNKSIYFLICDYARGGDLTRMMHKLRRTMEEPMARVIFVKIFTVLKTCHAKDVYHLDIKPNNILLKYSNVDEYEERQQEVDDEEEIDFHKHYQMDKEDFVMLADFGLSVVFGYIDQSYESSQSIYNPHEFVRRVFNPRGTPGYMAPETVLHGNYDPSKADMFSLGCTLYHVIVGCLPFHRDPIDIFDVVNSLVFRSFKDWVTLTFDPTVILGEKAWIRNGTISYPETLFPVYISEDAKNLLTLLLHPNPERRICFADDLMNHPWLVATTTTTTADVGRACDGSKQGDLTLPDSWEGDRTLALDEAGSQDLNFFPSYNSGNSGGRDERLSGNKRERESESVATGLGKTTTLFFSKIPWGEDYGQPDSKGHYELSVIYEAEEVQTPLYAVQCVTRTGTDTMTGATIIFPMSSSESSTTTSPDTSLDQEAIDIEGNVSYTVSEALLAA